MEKIAQALQYIRDNKTWTEAMEDVALEQISKMRCPLRMTSTGESICNNIRDLLDEYGEENGLPQDWWQEWGDEERFFFTLI